MLEKVKNDILSCGRCGMCIINHKGPVCPVHQHTEGFDEMVARGRNAIARAVYEGEIGLTQEVVDNSYTCLGCKNCQVACAKLDLKTMQLAIDEAKIQCELRKEIYKAGMEPKPLQAVDKAIEEKHNPFALAPSKRAAWADGLDLPDHGEVVYFAGCYAAYRNPKLAKATVQVLKAGGIDVAYLGEDEWCCGVPELNDGNEELAEQIIMHNIEALKAAGCKKVITSCAGCFHSLKSEYPEIAGEMPFEVVHTSEVIAELVKDGKINFTTEVPCKVTYHDPCHLGRYEGVYDAPREVLSAIPGVELVEMYRNKDRSWCCGGGSIVSNVYPELTASIAADRVDEAKGTGAEMIISTCPSCETHLNAAGRKTKMKTEDMNLLVAKAMGLQV